MAAAEQTPKGSWIFRNGAEEGNQNSQRLLGEWFLEHGHWKQALEWLLPLAEGDLRSEGNAAIALLALAGTDSQYEKQAESWLRRFAARSSNGDGYLVMLARGMRSWKGRSAEALGLLAGLAGTRSGEAAHVLALWCRATPKAATEWHCLAIELGFTKDWRVLQELLLELPQDGVESEELTTRVRSALDTAKTAEDKAARIRAKLDAEAAQKEAERREKSRAANRLAHVEVGPATVATVVATAAVMPFLQAIAAKSAGDAYDKARAFMKGFFRREGRVDGTGEPSLHVVVDPDAGITFQIRGGVLGDDALRALAEADLEALGAPDPRGRRVIVYWSSVLGQWRRAVE
ncbi:hypothetical protein [Streptomyces violascens]|uniref:hypothetical protein n=1 Tax=Streptomyces violascens TaxID=67381 RepID=UPI00365769AF